jgi:hypothetical protein
MGEQSQTIRSATAASVPLAWAAPKRTETPSSVRKRSVGKAAASSAGFHFATSTATTVASATASTPTLMREVRLTAMTTPSAISDRIAGLARAAMSPR